MSKGHKLSQTLKAQVFQTIATDLTKMVAGIEKLQKKAGYLLLTTLFKGYENLLKIKEVELYINLLYSFL